MNGDSEPSEVLKRLDTIIAVLQLAFKDRIDVARQQIINDPIAAEILELAANGWIEAGDLKRQVALKSQQSERTVGRRIAGLVAQRVLEQTGSGPRTRYRVTGLI
jgi:hypothetical protein